MLNFSILAFIECRALRKALTVNLDSLISLNQFTWLTCTAPMRSDADWLC